MFTREEDGEEITMNNVAQTESKETKQTHKKNQFPFDHLGFLVCTCVPICFLWTFKIGNIRFLLFTNPISGILIKSDENHQYSHFIFPHFLKRIYFHDSENIIFSSLPRFPTNGTKLQKIGQIKCKFLCFLFVTLSYFPLTTSPQQATLVCFRGTNMPKLHCWSCLPA